MKIALKDCTCFPLSGHAKGKSARGSAGQKPVPFRRITLRTASSINKITVQRLATGQAGRLTAFAEPCKGAGFAPLGQVRSPLHRASLTDRKGKEHKAKAIFHARLFRTGQQPA